MTKETIEKKLWLLDREIKNQGKKLDALLKAVLSLEKDIKDFIGVQKTYGELVTNVVDDES
jgi:glycine cleavage system aminomethyltransferase T